MTQNETTYTIPGEVTTASFVERPNRFLVHLIPKGRKRPEKAFLHDPGRMNELLVPDATLYIRKPLTNKPRKTKWDILAVEKSGSIIVINSSIPNKLVKYGLENHRYTPLEKYTRYKPEYTIGNSRLDFLLKTQSEKALVEVKGVTLIKNDQALFPDAPTKRGRRHIQELIDAKKEGYQRTFVLFIVMSGVPDVFTTNIETDPKFSKKLKEAASYGVEILAYKFKPYLAENRIHLELVGSIPVEHPEPAVEV